MQGLSLILSLFVGLALLPPRLTAEHLHVLDHPQILQPPQEETKQRPSPHAPGVIRMPLFTITAPLPKSTAKKDLSQKSSDKKPGKAQTSSR